MIGALEIYNKNYPSVSWWKQYFSQVFGKENFDRGAFSTISEATSHTLQLYRSRLERNGVFVTEARKQVLPELLPRRFHEFAIQIFTEPVCLPACLPICLSVYIYVYVYTLSRQLILSVYRHLYVRQRFSRGGFVVLLDERGKFG